jgi:hypothetical protein
MKTKGFYWHIHHGVLCEWSDDIAERIACIKTQKPERERALRLKRMKPVKGKLPVRFVEAYVKAREAYEKAGALGKAWVAYYKAQEALGKAWEACKDELEALHKKECRGCPWDGKTLFPKKVKA